MTVPQHPIESRIMINVATRKVALVMMIGLFPPNTRIVNDKLFFKPCTQPSSVCVIQYMRSLWSVIVTNWHSELCCLRNKVFLLMRFYISPVKDINQWNDSADSLQCPEFDMIHASPQVTKCTRYMQFSRGI